MFGQRRREASTLKLFYAADIHGSETCFGKFLNAAKYYDVELLVFGGDMTGKALVPIVRRPDGTWDAEFLGRQEVVHDELELEQVERQIRFNGFYPYRCDIDELGLLQSDPTFRARTFTDVMRRDTARWMDIADERLRAAGVPCFAMPGNDDGAFVGELLSQAATVENCDETVLDVNDFQMLSLGYSNPTPWNSPRELPDEQLLTRIDSLAEGLDLSRPAIFNLHPPPFDTGLDSAPELREDLSLVGGAGARMVPVGSRAVRDVVQRYQPLLSLHGHIHESRAVARLGRSVCINPGSEYNTGILRGVIVTIAPERVVGYQFVAA